MKPFLRLSTSAIALAAIFLLGAGLTHAADNDEPARRTAAENLLTAMHTEQMIDQGLTRMLTYVDRFDTSVAQAPGATPEVMEKIKAASEEARDTIRKELGYATLKDEFAKDYAEAFTEAELKEITAFYSSPAGQKFVEKQPAVTEKVSRVSQQKMQTVMPGVLQKLREVAQKNLPPPPTPAAAVPAPGAPAAPAAPGSPTAPTAPTAPIAPVPPSTPGVPPTVATPPISVTTRPMSAPLVPPSTPAEATKPPAQ